MAISPGMILVPSNLIIQKEKIPGYNNVLMLATDKMKFGKNTGTNYKAPAEVTKTITPSKTTQVNPKTTQVTQSSVGVVSKAKQKPNVASEILGVTMMIGGFLISRYIF